MRTLERVLGIKGYYEETAGVWSAMFRGSTSYASQDQKSRSIPQQKHPVQTWSDRIRRIVE